MAKLRKTARIISVAKDTATNDESSEEAEFDDNESEASSNSSDCEDGGRR